MALIAATPIVTQPAPLSSVAANSCQGRGGDGPAEHAGREQDGASFGHCCDAKAPVERRQVGHHDRADQEMHGDGGRDQRQRPACPLEDRLQIDGGAVKTHSETEHGQNEGRADHAPAMVPALMHSPPS
jgi:hypothetical protein